MSLADTIPGGFCTALDMPENSPAAVEARIAARGLGDSWVPWPFSLLTMSEGEKAAYVAPTLLAQQGTGLVRVRSELASARRAADRGERDEALRQIDLIRSTWLPTVSPAEFGIAHSEIEVARAQTLSGVPLSGQSLAVQQVALAAEKQLQADAAEAAKTADARRRREAVALDVAKRCPQLYESYGDVWSPEKLLAACNVANKEGICAALPQPAAWACNHPWATAGLAGAAVTAPWWLPWFGRLVSGARGAAREAVK